MVNQRHETIPDHTVSTEELLEHAQKEIGKLINAYRGSLLVTITEARRQGKSPWAELLKACRRIYARESGYENERKAHPKVYITQGGAKRRKMKPTGNY